MSSKPETETEAVTDDGPGIGVTLISLSTHDLTSKRPGSDKVGVPASEIRDKILPSFKYSMMFCNSFCSLNLW